PSAEIPPLSAPVHHAVSRCLQRQSVQEQPAGAGGDRRVCDGHGDQHGGEPGGGAVRAAVLFVFAPRRTAGGQVRQGRHRALGQAGGDCHHGGGGGGVVSGKSVGTSGGAVRHGDAVDFFRPHQVFDPAPAPAPR